MGRKKPSLDDELTNWVKEHGPLSFSALKRTGCQRLYNAAGKRYGGLEAAAKELGLPFKSRVRKFPDNQFRARLTEWVEEHGPLSFSALKSTGCRELYYAAKYRHGSLEAAAKMLDLPFEPLIRKRSKAVLDAELSQWVEEFGALHYSALKRTGRRELYQATWKQYGSLETAARTLGLPFDQGEWKRSEAQLRDEFSQWVEEYGPLCYSGLKQTGYKKLYQTAQHRFGSLEAAAKAFDLPFVRMWGKNGRSEEQAEINLEARAERKMKDLYHGAMERFGSLEAAANAGMLPSMDASPQGRGALIPRKGVVRRLRTRQRKGLSVDSHEVLASDPKLHDSAVHHFGSVERALELAGKRRIP